MKLSKEVLEKHRWLLKELRAISDELREMEENYAGVSHSARGEGRQTENS